MNQLIAILVANLSLLGAIMLIFYKSWLDKIRPDWFIIFNIYENGLFNFTEHKFFLPISGKKDVYVIKGNAYDKTGSNPKINKDGVYTWNFVQGKAKPIDFQARENIDGNLLAEAKKITLDDIWFNNNGLEDFLKNYGIIILGIIMLAFLGYFITKDQKTTEILLNISRRP